MPGEFFGEIAPCSPGALRRRRRETELRCLVLGGFRSKRSSRDPRYVPHAPSRSAQAPQYDAVAELTERPYPPGDYSVVVIGSGPGGLQTSYSLSRLGVRHAVLSEDDAPGGMFRRWPLFQRLITWTKPFSPAPRSSRYYERYDWNSLLSEDEAHRA